MNKNYREGATLGELDSQEMTAEERELLLLVLRRKFEVKEGILSSQSKKPKSENRWKFVVKKCIKFMKRRVKYNSLFLMRGEKLEDEKEFFNFYFRDTAESLHIPIESFYLPNSKLRNVQSPEKQFHTVRKSYIKLLCCSP